MRGLKDKVAIVTGGGQGIGRGIALRLAEEGCKVALFDMNPEAGAETEKLAGDATVKTYRVDVTDYDGIKALSKRLRLTLARSGRWSTMPVGICPRTSCKPISHCGTRSSRSTSMVRLNTHHIVAPLMVARGGGRIINIASDAARVGTSTEAVYSACKGGVIAFTKSVARELARNNVLLNVVCPGPTNTPMMAGVLGEGEAAMKWKDAMVRGIPLRRMGEIEDYGGIVAFLASDDASFMTGQTVSVAGGMNMI